MKEEIKEILECIKDKKRDYVGTNGCLYQDLDRKELNLLLDYITNLQEENERLKLELSGYREAILREDKLLGLQEYKQRNEIAIQYIKLGKTFENKETETIKKLQNDLLNILNGDDEE